MNDRTVPVWLKVVIGSAALAQIGFGLTLFVNPAAVAQLWPWPLNPITARLLGASSLVSVPMAALIIVLNRWTAARIALVMMIMYRVLQLAAGIIHLDHFNLASTTGINYFGGGTLMLVTIGVALWRGSTLGKPADPGRAWLRGDAPLVIGRAMRGILIGVSAVYFLLGVLYLVLGSGAEALWFEPAGNLTSLTARLFASPLMGLALGLWLIVHAQQWRQVAIPAIGMITFGFTGTLSMILESGAIAPPSPLGYLFPITPLVLFAMGVYLLDAHPVGGGVDPHPPRVYSRTPSPTRSPGGSHRFAWRRGGEASGEIWGLA
jgi:hypothetical protein